MKKYLNYKAIILVFSFFSILYIGTTVYNRSQDMTVLKKLAEIIKTETVGATGGCPAQFGGIGAVVIPCQTGMNLQTGQCMACTNCNPSYIANYTCATYSEVQFAPAGGDGSFVCIPQNTKFFGGGIMLKTGISIMTCSLNEAFHYAVAISN